MNKIFKVIYSKTKHCYVVASEFAKANTKSTSTSHVATKAALAVAFGLMVSFSGIFPGTYTAQAEIKRTLVGGLNGSKDDVRALNWYISNAEAFDKFAQKKSD